MDLESKNPNIKLYNIFYLADLSIRGKGIIDASEFFTISDEEEFISDDSVYSLEIEDGITGIKAGFLEKLPSLQHLTIASTINHIEMTSELESLLNENDVIIHGEYDTYAEEFAKTYGLKFIQSDIILAKYESKKPQNVTILILKFNIEGKAWIFEENLCAGNSAGNIGGGEVNYDIPKDFFLNCTVEKFSKHFSQCFHNDILNNDKLKRFFEKVNQRPNICASVKNTERNDELDNWKITNFFV